MRCKVGNGTKVSFVSAKLAPNARITTETLPNGVEIPSVHAKDIDYIILKVDNCNEVLVEGMEPGEFPMRYSTFNKKIKLPVKEKRPENPSQVQTKMIEYPVSVSQFPLNQCFAVTCHKVQGRTLSKIIIGRFMRHKKMASSWIYVALSRVKTLNGLILMEPLPVDVDLKLSKNYVNFMKKMKKNVREVPIV